MTNVKEDFLNIARRLDAQCVYECGSRDAVDGMELARCLGARELHIFECNPDAIDLCRRNLTQFSGSAAVHFNPIAVAESEGEMDFFSIDPAATVTDWPDGNIGASSLFVANPTYPYERYIQRRIRVPSVSLDAYCRDHAAPDLLWLDLQGAELRVFRGAGTVLPRVRVIHIEVMFRHLYLGQPLFWEIDRFLRKQFKLVRLYDVRSRALLRLNTLLGREKWFTDAVYVNRKLPGYGTL